MIIKERIDYFLIWGNGLKFCDEIIDMIRRHPAFNILAMHRISIHEDMTSFVKKIYSCDAVPIEHLAGKTRYLTSAPPEVILVLVKNKYCLERMFGEGEFKHVQCATVKAFKEEIRNKYNPKDSEGKRTEQHVIHASDYEEQVDSVLEVLSLPKSSTYVFKPNENLDCSPFLGKFEYESSLISLRNMYVDLVNGQRVTIEDSPHYRFLLGEEEPYKKYWNDNWGRSLIEDHSIESFNNLKNRYKYSSEGRNLIVVMPTDGGKYVILDGAHRASILLSYGFDLINCAVVVKRF